MGVLILYTYILIIKPLPSIPYLSLQFPLLAKERGRGEVECD